MNYRVIRFVGGLTAVITHILTCFEAGAEDNYSTIQKLQCGTTGQVYTANGNQYTCTYSGVAVTCALQGANTNTGSGTGGTGAGLYDSINDMVANIDTPNGHWRYLTPSETSGMTGITWCPGGYVFVAHSGEIPGWETNVPKAAGQITVCCSKPEGWGTKDFPTTDTASVTAGTILVPNIQFKGCAPEGKTNASATAAYTAVCVNKVSGNTGLLYGNTISSCCTLCPCAGISNDGVAAYVPSIRCPFATYNKPSATGGYKYVIGEHECTLGAPAASDNAGTYIPSQCYWEN